jgi:tRNA(Arg) A34 adenosine deaminase TadA
MIPVERCLEVIEESIVPLTRAGVAGGNKLFGAAILRRSDLSVVVAATNEEVASPLWHGEITALRDFFALPSHPPVGECLFLATHEPCSLCLSGITWSGFDTFAYLFSHDDSAESFAIPHDLAILRAVFAVPDPDRTEAAPGRDRYNRVNEFFTSYDLAALVRDSGRPELAARTARLAAVYDELSATYQASKGSAPNIALI